MPSRSSVLLIAPLALFALPATSQPPDSQQIPTIRVTTRTVIVDVVVTDDRGNPIRGLKASAFTLREDGVPQKLSSFEEHDSVSSPPVPLAPALPQNTFAVEPPTPESVTKTLIVLDQLHYPSFPLVRSDLLAFTKAVPSGHPIAIVRLDWQGLHLVQDFTSDPKRLQQVVASKEIMPPFPSFDTHEWTGCSPPYRGISNPYQRLARFLDGIPGRVNLAWITDEGKPDDFLGNEYSGMTAFTRNLNGSTGALRLGRVSFYAIKAGGYVGGMLQPLAAPDIPVPKIIPQSQMEPMPIDCPLMPAANGGLLANQALADAAKAVGGHAFFDGATQALTQILNLGSDFYTVSYTPSNTHWNGALRTITIKVNAMAAPQHEASGWSAYGQPNVIFRSSYYARAQPALMPNADSSGFGLQSVSTTQAKLNPLELTPNVQLALQTAMSFGALPPAQIAFAVTARPSTKVDPPLPWVRPANLQTAARTFATLPRRNYQLHYWIDPKSLKLIQTQTGVYREDLRIASIVFGDDGQAGDLTVASTHVQVRVQDLETILTTGITFDRTISIPIAPPGSTESFFLRLGVMDTSTGRIGVIELPVDQIAIPPEQTVPAPDETQTPAGPTQPR
jgi:VWFA-related protein